MKCTGEDVRGTSTLVHRRQTHLVHYNTKKGYCLEDCEKIFLSLQRFSLWSKRCKLSADVFIGSQTKGQLPSDTVLHKNIQ